MSQHGNLDPDMAWEIMSLLSDINRRGTTVVVATHAKDIVDKMQKRVVLIEKGNIISDKENSGYEPSVDEQGTTYKDFTKPSFPWNKRRAGV